MVKYFTKHPFINLITPQYEEIPFLHSINNFDPGVFVIVNDDSPQQFKHYSEGHFLYQSAGYRPFLLVYVGVF
jgi:hypothetical protein